MIVPLKQLQLAIVVAQHKSLRQAADFLNVRQSTLSRSLRDLEFRIGIILFERTSGGTRPTAAAQEFLEGACKILDETNVLVNRLKSRSRGESGQLIIGVHASLTAGNLRATLVDYHQRYPGVEIQLVDGSSASLIGDLERSTIDVAFIMEGSPHWKHKSLPVWSERLVVAIPKTHPLCGRDIIYWSDLEHERLLLPQRGPGPEFLRLLVSKTASIETCHIVYHDTALDRLLTLVGSGFGLMIALEGATGLNYPGITFHELHGADGPTRFGLQTYWRSPICNPCLNLFLDVLQERYPDLAAK